MSKVALFIFLSLGTLLLSCSTAPDFPDEPVITFSGVSKTVFNQNAEQGTVDTVFFTLTFTDGDGNLGDSENGRDIEIVDSRTGDVFATPSLPMLPIQGSGNGTEGEITIRTILLLGTDFCCLPPEGLACRIDPDYPQDTLQYLIRIRDRADNWSNQVSTPDLFINCN